MLSCCKLQVKGLNLTYGLEIPLWSILLYGNDYEDVIHKMVSHFLEDSSVKWHEFYYDTNIVLK